MDELEDTRARPWPVRLANTQFGLLHYDDLVAGGLKRGAIENWVKTGRLQRLHDKVFAFGHTVLTREGRWLAAIWAAGPHAVLSHQSAAAFHGMRDEDRDAPVHVSTTESIKSRGGIVVHRVRHLDRADIFTAHPLRVTHIPRTLIDLADILPFDEYRKAADQLPNLQLEKISEAQDRTPGRRGAPLVTRLIQADDAHTKSEFERRFLKFLRAHSLPSPDHLNIKIAGHKADCHYIDDAVIIELDGRAHHQRRDQMRADRRRDADYQAAKLRVLRFVWDDLHPAEAAKTAARLRRFVP